MANEGNFKLLGCSPPVNWIQVTPGQMKCLLCLPSGRCPLAAPPAEAVLLRPSAPPRLAQEPGATQLGPQPVVAWLQVAETLLVYAVPREE